jgi:hypothetical protein
VKNIKGATWIYSPEDGVEKQADWLVTYKIDPIRLGRMCEKFPALQKSWNDFKLVYELCRSQDDIDRQDP